MAVQAHISWYINLQKKSFHSLKQSGELDATMPFKFTDITFILGISMLACVGSSHFFWLFPGMPGQPRRHLLQSGWSVFVSSKRLVAGDAFIFLRFDALLLM